MLGHQNKIVSNSKLNHNNFHFKKIIRLNDTSNGHLAQLDRASAYGAGGSRFKSWVGQKNAHIAQLVRASVL